jgi:hypothetical protein
MIIHLQFGFSQFISFREDLWNFSQSEHIIGPGSHVEYPTGTKNSNFVGHCHHLASVVCCLLSVNFSHFKLLLRNHWANWNQTLQECSLNGPLQSYCFSFQSDIQHGCQKCEKFTDDRQQTTDAKWWQ